MPTEQERLDFLIGEVIATRAALLAVIVVHPDPPALRSVLDDALNKGLGRLEPTSAPDQAIAGYQETAKSLRRAAGISD